MASLQLKLILGLCLATLALLGAKPAAACSCAPSTTAQLVGFATTVYRGTVVFAETPATSADALTYRLLVTDVWKGDVDSLDTVSSFLSLCGLALQEGEEYLVFANEGMIDNCSGTKKIADASLNLTELGASEPPASASMQTAFRNSQISGTWYQPDRPGQGLQIQVLPDGRAAVTFFGHSNDSEPRQVWLLGIGEFFGDELRVAEVVQTNGRGFGIDFSPSQTQTVPWGSFLLRFRGHTLSFSYQSNLPGFPGLPGTSSITMKRLTRTPASVLLGGETP